MRALVTYYSESGNTERVARAIYDALEAVDRELEPLMNVDDFTPFDAVFFGFPVHSHGMPAEAQKALQSLPRGITLALFGTHGSLRGGPLVITAFHNAMSVTSAAEVIGTFGCQGRVKLAIIEALINHPEHRGWALEAQGSADHPDAVDLEDAADFARRMVAKLQSNGPVDVERIASQGE